MNRWRGAMVTNKQPPEITEHAFQFAVRIVKLRRHLDEKPGGSRTLAKQLLRSGTSIGANLEEGKGSQSEADYLAKCYIACKEARETLYWFKLEKCSHNLSPSGKGATTLISCLLTG